MFKNEANGYNRQEVDEYITRLKADMLEQKFSLLEAEKRFFELQNKKDEVDAKEKSILKAIQVFEDAQKFQEEGSRNMYALKSEQMLLVYRKFEDVLKKIYLLHPEIKSDRTLETPLSELDDLLDKAKSESQSGILTSPINSNNDSMRVLLGKMQEYRRSSEPAKEVKISRVNPKVQNEIKEPDGKFDLKEAVNPKMGLEEIMKAFDFFNNES